MERGVERLLRRCRFQIDKVLNTAPATLLGVTTAELLETAERIDRLLIDRLLGLPGQPKDRAGRKRRAARARARKGPLLLRLKVLHRRLERLKNHALTRGGQLSVRQERVERRLDSLYGKRTKEQRP